MLLRKTLSLNEVQLKAEGEGGTFSGYASVFGGVDSYGDTILKGAFASTLRQHGLPKMFFNHEWTMPVGKFLVAKEDDHGLYVEGELTPGMGLAEDVRAALRHGTLDGLSIGGYVKQGDYDTTETGRVIRKWSRLIEVSPVAFPADSSARIDLASVKSDALATAIEEIDSLRELELFLRDAGGFSKDTAAALLTRARKVLAGDTQPASDLDEKSLQALAARITRLGIARH
ncbi:HK97 family phage prohead protease [Eleftheria terrae]|uniref:HK97 family phage prohead protease n=1 Tax=Eleftheria terrae TaxID=1597781 RepID=UPI00263A42ED|nr:HK97 family phage prohead protease [Eleftheria terrae]WKB52304.1 HK97 family phage prohead protease [Eleftheria terrae]